MWSERDMLTLMPLIISYLNAYNCKITNTIIFAQIFFDLNFIPRSMCSFGMLEWRINVIINSSILLAVVLTSHAHVLYRTVTTTTISCIP